VFFSARAGSCCGNKIGTVVYDFKSGRSAAKASGAFRLSMVEGLNDA